MSSVRGLPKVRHRSRALARNEKKEAESGSGTEDTCDQSLEKRVHILEEKKDEFPQDVFAFAFIVCRAVRHSRPSLVNRLAAVVAVTLALVVGALQVCLPVLVVKEDVFDTVLNQDITLSIVNFFTCVMLIFTLEPESDTAENLIVTGNPLGIFLGLFQLLTNLILINFSAAYVFAMSEPKEVVLGGLTLSYWATLDDLTTRAMLQAFGEQPLQAIGIPLKLDWAVRTPRQTDAQTSEESGSDSDSDSCDNSGPSEPKEMRCIGNSGVRGILLRLTMKFGLPWLAIILCWSDQRSIPFRKCSYPFDECKDIQEVGYERITSKRFCQSAARYFSLRSVLVAGEQTGDCWFDGFSDQLLMSDPTKSEFFNAKLKQELHNLEDRDHTIKLFQPKYIDLGVPSMYYSLTGGLLQQRRFAVLLAPESICRANRMEDIITDDECQLARKSCVWHLGVSSQLAHKSGVLQHLNNISSHFHLHDATNASSAGPVREERVLRARSCVLYGFGGEAMGVIGSRVLCRMPRPSN